MRTIAKLLFLILLSTQLKAQRVNGVVLDDLNHAPLRLASVVVISQPDSFIVSSVRSANDGTFSIPLLKGRYRILVSHPAYIDFTDSLIIRTDSTVNLGSIKMLNRSIALKEFVVKRNLSSIKMKGDTLEYVADSFKVVPNASVEDLLKVLPGMQVNKNGEISAQGQTIQKVYVDGEEFFGDDPTLATQNLKADAVDKVQVFDEKTEEASFTGFDDGESKKAINIKLKEGKNKGVFGKVRAGAGTKQEGNTDPSMNSQAMVNSFRGARKLSAFGLYSNTGQVGLGYQDRESFGEPNQTEYNPDDGVYYSYGDEDNSANFYGQGIPKVLHTGLHFSNKWNENQNKINGTYRFKQQITDANTRNNTQYFLPDSSYFNFERNNSHNDRRTHRLNTRFDYAFDTTFSLNLKLRGIITDERSGSVYFSENIGSSGFMMSKSQRDLQSNRLRNDLSGDFSLRKRLKKKGRTISLFASLSDVIIDADNILKSANSFYSDTVSTETINQFKTTDDNRLTVSGRAIYTEPLGSKYFLELSYRIQRGVSSLYKNTFNYTGATGDYMQKNDSLSNSFRFNNTIHTPGIAIRYNYKKIMYNLGLSVAEAGFYQNDLVRDQDRRYSQRNYFPSAGFNYKANPYSNFRIRYNGSTNQPQIEQVQPLTDNTDPMNVFIGNPGLKQEYTNNISLSYNTYKAIAGRGFWGSFWAVNTLDQIVLKQELDPYGRRINQYINQNGSYNMNFYSNYFFKINKIKTKVDLGLNGSRRQDVNQVFGQRSLTVNQNVSVELGLNYQIEKRFEVGTNLELALNNATNSLQRSNITYTTFSPDFYASYYSKKGWELSTEFEYNFREKTPPFNTNFSQFIWNASLNRKFLKDKSLELELYVYDILQQNRGYQRNVYQSYARERFYNTVTRYFMVNLIWNFHKGAAVPGRD